MRAAGHARRAEQSTLVATRADEPPHIVRHDEIGKPERLAVPASAIVAAHRRIARHASTSGGSRSTNAAKWYDSKSSNWSRRRCDTRNHPPQSRAYAVAHASATNPM